MYIAFHVSILSSSTPPEDVGYINSRIHQASSKDGNNRNVSSSAAKESFLNLPQREGFSSPRSAPSTPHMEDKLAPSFSSSVDMDFSLGKDTSDQEKTFSRENSNYLSFHHVSNANAPSLEWSKAAPSIRSGENRNPQQHPLRRNPSLHYTQSASALTLRRDRDPRSSFHPNSEDLSLRPVAPFQSVVPPIYIESVAISPKRSVEFTGTMHKSCSSPAVSLSTGGGTLPRSSKKRINPDSVPVSIPIFVQPHWTSMEQGLDKRYRMLCAFS